MTAVVLINLQLRGKDISPKMNIIVQMGFKLTTMPQSNTLTTILWGNVRIEEKFDRFTQKIVNSNSMLKCKTQISKTICIRISLSSLKNLNIFHNGFVITM